MRYLKESNKVWLASDEATTDFLEPKTYVIKVHPMRGFYLETIDNFELPSKIYGDIDTRVNRIINTFETRPAQTGVLLTGEKGSGKTLISKKVSLTCLEKGMPTLVVNTPFVGDDFNSFMSSIDTPCVVIFDEFEKVYDEEEHQPHLLTLLDGVFNSKKLFLLTCNDRFRLNEHIMNRPSRIFYKFEYSGLEEDFIIDYCNDRLKDLTKLPQILNVKFSLQERFNFDILASMVEELNRYGENVSDVMKVLNVSPLNEASMYAVSVRINGTPVLKCAQREIWMNPFNEDDKYRLDLQFLGKRLTEDSWQTVISDPKSVKDDSNEVLGYNPVKTTPDNEDDVDDCDMEYMSDDEYPKKPSDKQLRVWAHRVYFNGKDLSEIDRPNGCFVYNLTFGEQTVTIELARQFIRSSRWDDRF